MAIPLTINGATFEYPQNFDENWGVEATGWAQAVTNGLLQMSGGNFPLTADVNFGPNFGLLSKYFETRSANPATTGTVRLSSADAGIAWRNNANSGNLILTTDASDNLLYNGSTISGGVNAGTQYKLGYYATTSSNISPNPNTMAATQVLVTDANGVPTTTGNGATTATEIGYVHGVTSAIQTQIDATVKSVTGTANQITSTGGTTPVLAIANPLTLPGPMTAGGNIAMASNKVTGLANATASGDALSYKSGVVIQSVFATHSADVSSTTSTFVDTGLSASITLTNSSNFVRITVSHGCATSQLTAATGADLGIRILRDASVIQTYPVAFGTGGGASPGGVSTRGRTGVMYTDAPGDTSAHTYKTQFNNTNNANTVSIYDSSGGQGSILLEEIAS